MSAVPFEPAGESEFPAPMPLAPGGGITVTAESVLLRWSSAGVLPGGLYYVVAIREATDDADAGGGPIVDLGGLSGATDGGDNAGGELADEEAEGSGVTDPSGDAQDARLVWVTDATAVRIPGELRPALGNSRPIEWSVSVRRRGAGGLLGSDESVLLSPTPRWQRFVWAPSPSLDEGPQAAP
jgi:hypothetical protein